MHQADIPIPDPCEQSWDGMHSVASHGRFCWKCERTVVDLSGMTEKQARRFLKRNRDHDMCVSYLVHGSGELEFARAPARRLPLAPTVVGLSLAAAACGTRPIAGAGPAPTTTCSASETSAGVGVSAATPASTSANTAGKEGEVTPPPTRTVQNPKLTRLGGAPMRLPPPKKNSTTALDF